MFDLEASVNINGMIGSQLFTHWQSDGQIKPYRLWARYATPQLEVRLGLQKINFGSATMIRPLMWFDQIDPRDPLKLTDGVWGVLGRYYFLNNANVWLWVLYGNEQPKTWETGNTSQNRPEAGARLQLPVPRGEVALSAHHRLVDFSMVEPDFAGQDLLPENRIGIDGKWDVEVGLWFEAAWFHRPQRAGMFANQMLATLGTDYTFGLGNGLNVILEQLLVSYDQKLLALNDPFHFSVLSVSYPFGFSDNLNAMVYYDWNHSNSYTMLTWSHQVNQFSFYLLGYHNPVDYQIPLSTGQANLFAGTGVQVMLVFNH